MITTSKTFFFQVENAKRAYQIAFFMFINEFAINCAKGLSAKKSDSLAMKTTYSVMGLNQHEINMFHDLKSCFTCNNHFIYTTFFYKGLEIKAKVTYTLLDKYMQCV